MTRLHGDRESDSYRRTTIAVGHYVGRANKGFSLTVARGVALGISEKFYPEGRVRRAIQATLNGRATAATMGRGEHWIVLQIIRAGVGIAVVIGCHAARVFGATNKIDSETAVREDGIAENGVVDRGDGGVSDHYPGVIHITRAAVKGDDVARANGRAANGIVVAINGNAESVA
jgi:hypothetical protein